VISIVNSPKPCAIMAMRQRVVKKALLEFTISSVRPAALSSPLTLSTPITGAATSKTFGRASRSFHVSSRCLSSAASTESPHHINYPHTHARISNPSDTPNFIDNQFISSKATQWIDLHDPATNNLVTRVPQNTVEELEEAVSSAERAFPKWKATSLLHRQQVMLKYVALIRENWDRLAASITLEQGKTLADAKGDVLRGLQVAETACGITTQFEGSVLEVAKDMETRSYREPLGIVAAICPFSEFYASL
jgi:malonate-semialdehyde dehydrogenase (acetylating) / methylmalonate-semialdehyde dehydrogenase